MVISCLSVNHPKIIFVCFVFFFSRWSLGTGLLPRRPILIPMLIQSTNANANANATSANANANANTDTKPNDVVTVVQNVYLLIIERSLGVPKQGNLNYFADAHSAPNVPTQCQTSPLSAKRPPLSAKRPPSAKRPFSAPNVTSQRLRCVDL